jgi:hypothetical protein
MEPTDDSDGELRQQLILASAFFHGDPPTDRIRASSARVLRHALIAAGLWDDTLEAAAPAVFTGDEAAVARFPVVEEWYSTLIQLTRKRPKSARLLDGGGNMIAPAAPYFTGCWLTPAGRSEAERLLAQHPQWHAKLSSAR